MKIAIVGYGQQGQSAYYYWRSPDNEITICDRDESLELRLRKYIFLEASFQFSFLPSAMAKTHTAPKVQLRLTQVIE